MRMSPKGITRRTTLIGAGTALTGLTVATPVSARSNDLAHELNTVRAATRKYQDVSKARVDGYDTEISPYTPGMGFHFVNPTFVAPNAAGPFDLETPPILVYVTKGNYNPGPGDIHNPERDDDLCLAAVEFAHVGDDGAPGTSGDIFSDEDARRNLKVSEEDGWEWVPTAEITALHVWVHRGNPAGVFNPTNPIID